MQSAPTILVLEVWPTAEHVERALSVLNHAHCSPTYATDLQPLPVMPVSFARHSTAQHSWQPCTVLGHSVRTALPIWQPRTVLIWADRCASIFNVGFVVLNPSNCLLSKVR